MPFYDFTCNKCGITQEKLLKRHSTEKLKCEKCNKKTMEIQISAPKAEGIVCYGAGAYKTRFDPKKCKMRKEEKAPGY